MLRLALAQMLQRTVDSLVAQGRIPSGLPSIAIEDPKDPSHGDFATNFAMVAARGAGLPPRALAELVAQTLEGEGHDLIASVEVAGPGFINLRLRPEAVATLAGDVSRDSLLAACKVPPDRRQRVNLEFVSVNPNGPITIGSGRGAAFGSTLANVLEAAGHTVHREYYINDGVNSEQMRLFAESVRHYLQGTPFPEGGYRGDYVQRVAEHLSPEVADLQASAQSVMLEAQRDDLECFGVRFDTWFSEQSLHDAGVVEREIASLVAKGVADERPVRTKLKLAKGGVIEDVILETQAGDADDHTQEEAPESGVRGDGRDSPGNHPSPPSPLSPGRGEGETLWLRSTKFGDDMDRVLRRKDGRLTYIASDVAYHKDKFDRTQKLPLPAAYRGEGESRVKLITILGPDHHGYIGRLHAVMAAVDAPPLNREREGDWGENPPVEAKLYATPEERDACRSALDSARQKLDVVIYQLVRFMKDGKPAPMRKRDGNIYALIDLIDEIGRKVKPEDTQTEQRKVGKDVARFFYLMRSHDTTFDFDLDLAEQQSDENPVFYVQYAHARISGVLRKAAEANLSASCSHLKRLTHPKETALIKKIVDLPHEVERAAEDYGVHRLTTYAIELARAYHHFYDACRVIQPEDPELSHARLALCEATRSALGVTFNLLGIEAPEHM